ncbi:IucA/IucC family protein [Luteibacter sahnii]|uniref:IucA/IucC family protein n=1 Tax=Luteibacter sahnii TaxID=3021977 RepID=UPI002A69E598|nr:IucA/IucC family protein [Luteibacter sp. PPL193]MDY1549894.1 IucA/IucC family protein [Luteibacter sp. PPL193]
MSPPAIRDQWYQAQAERQAIACWINCYLREFALPRGQADLDDRGHDAPGGLAHVGGRMLRMTFAEPGYALCIGIARSSRLGRCEFASPPYLKAPGDAWRCADADATVRFLLERLAPECGFNGELHAQTMNSIEVARQLLARSLDAPLTGDALLDAEQGMLWGHAMHPTPKSREGLPLPLVLDASPEIRARVPLFWFRIDPRLFRGQGRDVRATLATVSGGTDRYPCHPWEAERLLAQPPLQAAIAAGWVEPLGPLGDALYPTSSVRTMYHPALDYFLKLSIHVRLTNCVRKNAWYELESAVALTRLLEPVWRDVTRQVPGFDVMVEPAATTLDFSAFSDDADALRELTEGFGMLYRENLSPLHRKRYRPQVAGALFTTDRDGHSVCRRMVEGLGGPYAPMALAWFQSYAARLLEGTWLAFFRHGVVLEPHLQNTVVGFDRGMPARVWVRDLEGTKLVEHHWPAGRLDGLSERARASLGYSADRGWKRIAYCALVNNLAEAIFHLCGDDLALEHRMWQSIADLARGWQARHGRQPALQGLVDGDALPSKNNLRTRLFRRADRDADYTALPSPIGTQAPWVVAA